MEVKFLLVINVVLELFSSVGFFERLKLYLFGRRIGFFLVILGKDVELVMILDIYFSLIVMLGEFSL